MTTQHTNNLDESANNRLSINAARLFALIKHPQAKNNLIEFLKVELLKPENKDLLYYKPNTGCFGSEAMGELQDKGYVGTRDNPEADITLEESRQFWTAVCKLEEHNPRLSLNAARLFVLIKHPQAKDNPVEFLKAELRKPENKELFGNWAAAQCELMVRGYCSTMAGYDSDITLEEDDQFSRAIVDLVRTDGSH